MDENEKTIIVYSFSSKKPKMKYLEEIVKELFLKKKRSLLTFFLEKRLIIAKIPEKVNIIGLFQGRNPRLAYL